MPTPQPNSPKRPKGRVKVDIGLDADARIRALLRKWSGPLGGGEINVTSFVAEAIREKLEVEEAKQKGHQ